MKKCEKCGSGIIKNFCKKCYRKEYYLRTRKKQIERAALYHKKHRAKRLVYHREYNQKYYLTVLKNKRYPWINVFFDKLPKIRQCEVCGYDRLFEIHHVDPEKDRMDVDNMIMICPNCHMLIHRNLLSVEEILNERNKTIETVTEIRKQKHAF